MRRLHVLAVLGLGAVALAIALAGCASRAASPPPDRCEASGSSLQLLEPACWGDGGARVSVDAGGSSR